MSGGTIASIVVPVFLVILGMIIIILILVRLKKKRQNQGGKERTSVYCECHIMSAIL